MLKFQVETKGIQEQPLITHGVLLALLCSEIWFIPLAVSSISKQRFRLSRHSLDYGVIPHPHTSLEPIHQHETKRMYLVTIWNFKMLHTQTEKQNKPKKKKKKNPPKTKTPLERGAGHKWTKIKCCQFGATEHHEHAVKSKSSFRPSECWQSKS